MGPKLAESRAFVNSLPAGVLSEHDNTVTLTARRSLTQDDTAPTVFLMSDYSNIEFDKMQEDPTPLMQRFLYLASEQPEDTLAIDVGDFFALMQFEYKILRRELLLLRSQHIHTNKSPERIDGITKAINLVAKRMDAITNQWIKLGASNVSDDPIERAAKVLSVDTVECVCGDFRGSREEFDRHLEGMNALESNKAHRKVLKLKENVNG